MIRHFAEQIILKIGNEELLPSWFVRLYLKREYNETVKELKNEYSIYRDKQNAIIESENKTIRQKIAEIAPLQVDVEYLQKKIAKNSKRLEKLSTKKPNILKTIVTFGIYSFLISQKRKDKIVNQSELLNTRLSEVIFEIENKNNQIKTIRDTIQNQNELIKNKSKEIQRKIGIKNNEYNLKLSKIYPLANIVKGDDTFIPLKNFSGLKYEQIVGCYIIHNKEKDKYYVGQSKDIMKRLKQHFKHTTPINPIFLEDYYTSQYANKEDLFEVKIIKCATKDELDKTEKQLIYDYDSWNNGYNGTSGNS